MRPFSTPAILGWVIGLAIIIGAIVALSVGLAFGLQEGNGSSTCRSCRSCRGSRSARSSRSAWSSTGSQSNPSSTNRDKVIPIPAEKKKANGSAVIMGAPKSQQTNTRTTATATTTNVVMDDGASNRIITLTWEFSTNNPDEVLPLVRFYTRFWATNNPSSIQFAYLPSTYNSGYPKLLSKDSNGVSTYQYQTTTTPTTDNGINIQQGVPYEFSVRAEVPSNAEQPDLNPPYIESDISGASNPALFAPCRANYNSSSSGDGGACPDDLPYCYPSNASETTLVGTCSPACIPPVIKDLSFSYSYTSDFGVNAEVDWDTSASNGNFPQDASVQGQIQSKETDYNPLDDDDSSTRSALFHFDDIVPGNYNELRLDMFQFDVIDDSDPLNKVPASQQVGPCDSSQVEQPFETLPFVYCGTTDGAANCQAPYGLQCDPERYSCYCEDSDIDQNPGRDRLCMGSTKSLLRSTECKYRALFGFECTNASDVDACMKAAYPDVDDFQKNTRGSRAYLPTVACRPPSGTRSTESPEQARIQCVRSPCSALTSVACRTQDKKDISSGCIAPDFGFYPSSVAARSSSSLIGGSASGTSPQPKVTLGTPNSLVELLSASKTQSYPFAIGVDMCGNGTSAMFVLVPFAGFSQSDNMTSMAVPIQNFHPFLLWRAVPGVGGVYDRNYCRYDGKQQKELPGGPYPFFTLNHVASSGRIWTYGCHKGSSEGCNCGPPGNNCKGGDFRFKLSTSEELSKMGTFMANGQFSELPTSAPLFTDNVGAKGASNENLTTAYRWDKDYNLCGGGSHPDPKPGYFSTPFQNGTGQIGRWRTSTQLDDILRTSMNNYDDASKSTSYVPISVQVINQSTGQVDVTALEFYERYQLGYSSDSAATSFFRTKGTYSPYVSSSMSPYGTFAADKLFLAPLQYGLLGRTRKITDSSGNQQFEADPNKTYTLKDLVVEAYDWDESFQAWNALGVAGVNGSSSNDNKFDLVLTSSKLPDNFGRSTIVSSRVPNTAFLCENAGLSKFQTETYTIHNWFMQVTQGPQAGKYAIIDLGTPVTTSKSEKYIPMQVTLSNSPPSPKTTDLLFSVDGNGRCTAATSYYLCLLWPKASGISSHPTKIESFQLTMIEIVSIPNDKQYFTDLEGNEWYFACPMWSLISKFFSSS